MWFAMYLRANDLIAERQAEARRHRLARLSSEGAALDRVEASAARRLLAAAAAAVSRRTGRLALALDPSACVPSERTAERAG